MATAHTTTSGAGRAATDQRQGAQVTVRGVSKTFRTGGTDITATDGVSLEVSAGSTIALTGASGSGKSTLLHLIGGIESPDSGTITVDSVEITQLRKAELADYRRGVGFVFQRFHLLPTLTALDNVVAPVLPYRTPFDRVRRARELLDAVGLARRERSLPAHLSGGEQQRVAIARALLSHPRLLLADEPTGNLDTTTSAEIMRLLVDIRSQLPMTTIIATHEAAVRDFCDGEIRLRDGAIVDD